MESIEEANSSTNLDVEKQGGRGAEPQTLSDATPPIGTIAVTIAVTQSVMALFVEQPLALPWSP